MDTISVYYNRIKIKVARRKWGKRRRQLKKPVKDWLYKEPTDRIELSTDGLQNHCSTTELRRLGLSLIRDYTLPSCALSSTFQAMPERVGDWYDPLNKFGSGSRNRTYDTGLMSPLLYRLSYAAVVVNFSGL